MTGVDIGDGDGKDILCIIPIGRVPGSSPGLAAADKVLDVNEALDVILEVEETFVDDCVVVGFGRIPR